MSLYDDDEESNSSSSSSDPGGDPVNLRQPQNQVDSVWNTLSSVFGLEETSEEAAQQAPGTSPSTKPSGGTSDTTAIKVFHVLSTISVAIFYLIVNSVIVIAKTRV